MATTSRAHAVGPPARPRPSLLSVLQARGDDARPWLEFRRRDDADVLRFRDALVLVRRWAAALRAAGVVAGDRVGVWFPNGPQFVGAFFGAQWLGAVAVPLPWPATGLAPDLAAGIRSMVHAAQAAVVCAPLGLGDADWRVVSEPATHPLEAAALEGEASFIQFSSGSTGQPRGVVVSPRAVSASVHGMVDALALTRDDVGVSWLPFFHDMGLVGVVLTSLAAGFTVHVQQPAAFLLRPARWLELATSVRGTMTVAPNFAYELALRRERRPELLELSSLRAMLSGSEPVHRATIERFELAFAANGLRRGVVKPVYGLAENVLGVTFELSGAPNDLTCDGRSVPSVGEPLPGVEVAIRGEAGTVVDEGLEGEVTVRGPTVMTGYWNDASSTARALRDGWLFTGDRGVLRAGRLYLTGRDKELIIKAGRKFHPSDVERIVAEVVDTPPNGVVAFSVSDAVSRQEALVVVVEQRRAPDDDLAARIRGKVSAELGVMVDRVDVVGAGTLPRTTSGKLRRRDCTERFRGGP